MCACEKVAIHCLILVLTRCVPHVELDLVWISSCVWFGHLEQLDLVFDTGCCLMHSREASIDELVDKCSFTDCCVTHDDYLVLGYFFRYFNFCLLLLLVAAATTHFNY